MQTLVARGGITSLKPPERRWGLSGLHKGKLNMGGNWLLPNAAEWRPDKQDTTDTHGPAKTLGTESSTGSEVKLPGLLSLIGDVLVI